MSDFKFSCSHCQQSLEAPEEMRGQTIECPSCNGSIQIPAAEPESQESEPQPPTPQKPVKTCPFCGEEILASAIKCKHCGEFLNNQKRNAPVQNKPKLPNKSLSSMSSLNSDVQERSKGSTGTVSKIAGAILALAGSFGIYEYFGNNQDNLPVGVSSFGTVTMRSKEDITSKVSMGMTTEQVKAAVGEPNRKQEMNQSGIDLGDGAKTEGLRMDMWYYDIKGGMVQIAFQNGNVNSINQY